MKLLSLAELFDQHSFRTPDYQRGYAWKEENVIEFWEDIARINSNNPKHFMGTLILEVSEEGGSAPALVVDGQQRLTTAILLIAALSESLEQGFLPHVSAGFRQRYLGSSAQPKFRYVSNHDAWPFLAFQVFRDHAYTARAAGFENAYTQNLSAALEKLRELTKQLQPYELSALREKIENQLLFNVVEVDPKVFNIHVAFESINHRGRQLTQLELLKNRLIYLTTMMPVPQAAAGGGAEAELRSAVNSTWSDIYNWLGRADKNVLDEDEFLRTHSLMYFKTDTAAEKWLDNLLFKEQFSVSRVVDGDLTDAAIRKYLNSLRLAALLWSHIRRPRGMPSAQQLWLERIGHVHRPVFDPLILAAYMQLLERYPDRATDLRKLARIDGSLIDLLVQIERFIVLVFLVSGRRGHTARKELYKNAHALYSNNLYFRDGDPVPPTQALAYVARLVKSLISNYGEFEDGEYAYADPEFPWHGEMDLDNFHNQIRRDLQYSKGYYDWPLTKVLLFEYEDSLRQTHRGDRKVKWASVGSETIEHIYPQESSAWGAFNTKLGSRRKKAKFNSYCHSLGNLLLLSRGKNASLQNHPYRGKDSGGAKRPRFANGGSFSENEVAATFNDWTPASVEKRGKALLAFAEQRWDFSFNAWGRGKLKEMLVLE